MDARASRYHEIYARWQRDPLGFWGEAAADIDWLEKPKKVFDATAGIYGRWFVGGVCNTCFNAVDRHVNAGRGEQTAIIYDSPLAGAKRTLTYHRLLTETQVLGGMLRDLGVGKGDRVIIYSAALPRANSPPGSTIASRKSFYRQAAASSRGASCNISRCSMKRLRSPRTTRRAA